MLEIHSSVCTVSVRNGIDKQTLSQRTPPYLAVDLRQHMSEEECFFLKILLQRERGLEIRRMQYLELQGHCDRALSLVEMLS